MNGSAGGDYLDGGDGNDQLHGLAGDDRLIGGAGADVLDGGQGSDDASYVGASGGVNVNLATGDGLAFEAEGDRLISIENLLGGNFNDWLRGSNTANWLSGGEGSDRLEGGDGNDQLLGGAGNDLLIGDGGADLLWGGDGADTMSGGAGQDVAEYTDSWGPVWIDLAAGKGYWSEAEGDALIGIENVSGSLGDDRLTGDVGANVLAGGGGNDLLRGGAGADRLDGGTGTDTATYYASAAGVTVDLASGTGSGGDAQGDTVIGIENLTGSSQGNDILIGTAGANTLAGWGGDDVLRGGAGADTLDGGAGSDTASYYTSAAGVTVDLTAGTAAGGDAQGDTLSGFEQLSGSQFNDDLTGAADTAALRGWGGDDVLRVGSGSTLTMVLDGGAGRDLLSFWGTSDEHALDLQAHSQFISIEDVHGGQGTDTFGGNGGANTLKGFGGNDTLFGHGGNDHLDGGAGTDVLLGGSGMDQMTGGGGSDNFWYLTASDSTSSAAGRDLITDFSPAQGDRIRLWQVDANTRLAGDQAFTFIDNRAFTGVAGQLHYWYDSGQTIVSGDTNGDKLADFAIALTGILTLWGFEFEL